MTGVFAFPEFSARMARAHWQLYAHGQYQEDGLTHNEECFSHAKRERFWTQWDRFSWTIEKGRVKGQCALRLLPGD